VYNWGNYGVFYNLDIVISHIVPGIQVTGIYLNPRGGSYFGPLQMNERIIPIAKPIEPIREAVELETGMTMTGMTCHVPIRFMPPGGSSLPVRIIVGNVHTLEV
jgi:hypothetical protein